MSDTTFTNAVTLTDADWFNDLNRLHYTILGDPANLVALKATLGIGSASTTFLTGDVALNNVSNFFSGPNTGAIGAAGQTWLIIATGTITDTAGAANISMRISDGSNTIAESSPNVPVAGCPITFSINAVVSLTAATTFTLQARDATSTSGSILATGNNSQSNKATSITAVRIA